MEQTAEKKQTKQQIIKASEVYTIVFAFVISLSTHPLAAMMAFAFLGFSHLRNIRESHIVALIILIRAFIEGMSYFYLVSLCVIGFYCLIYFVNALNRNSYKYISYIVMLCTIPLSIQSLWPAKLAYIVPLFALFIMMQIQKEQTWNKARYILPNEITAIIFMAIALLFAENFPQYQDIFTLLSLASTAFICPLPAYLIIAFLSFSFFPLYDGAWYFFFGIIAQWKNHKRLLIISSLIYLLVQIENINQFVIVVICIGISAIINREKTDEKVKATIKRHPNNILQRQLQHYAAIFQELARYYHNLNFDQANLLDSMAIALKEQVDASNNTYIYSEDKMRLIEVLEGYKIEVIDFDFIEGQDGYLRLNLNIRKVHRSEIEQTIQPLLEGLIKKKLMITTVAHKGIVNDHYYIEFKELKQFKISTQGISIKSSRQNNGDTYALFNYRQSNICMLCDGMGKGNKAHESSAIIGSIFQHMIMSNINQNTTIRCINKLIQSDTFSTLDVMCFDYGEGIAYISKSAACPTYLIRDQKLHVIHGSALPIGIVAQIEPDCFQIAIHKNDVFVMISDGVDECEVKAWQHLRKQQTCKEDLKIFEELLNNKQRRDDSSVIIAMVE